MENTSQSENYSRKITRVFILSGAIMLITFPFFSELIPLSPEISIFAIIFLAVLGGLVGPKQKWVVFLNAVVPVIALGVFEYYAVYTYINLTPEMPKHVMFFWINQVLALTFFFATYLSVKMARDLFSQKRKDKEGS